MKNDDIYKYTKVLSRESDYDWQKRKIIKANVKYKNMRQICGLQDYVIQIT